MTRLFGVIGHPIAHSLSPAMHTAALRALRLDAIYTAIDAPPRFLQPILRALILAGIEGLNVTVPLKETILPLLDRVDPGAAAVGAVNTIVIRRRRAVGYNTDVAGFRLALAELGYRPRAGRVVVLGAGGAARALVWALSDVPGLSLTIANRHVERAKRLVRWLAARQAQIKAEAVPLSGVRLDGVTLLVNATTIGMKPGDRPPVRLDGLRSSALVYDLVYHRETALVREARRRGGVAAGGLSMLLYQGAESLRLWTGRRPPLAAMRRALEAAIQGKQE